MSSIRLLNKLYLLLFCFTVIGMGNISFAQTNKLINTDSTQTRRHYLDKQIICVAHVGKLMFIPSYTKITLSPKLYYKSNYFSKEIFGGIMGTGITVGLNYILFPYLAFSPEWRRNQMFMNISLGGQLAVSGSIAGVGIGFLPFSGISIGYNSYPLSKTFALNTEVGILTIIVPNNPYPIYSYFNVGLVYRRNRK